MIFFENHKQIILAITVISFLLVVFALADKLLLSKSDTKNYLAQIMAVETDLLKAWQRSKGLQNTLTYNSVGNDVILLQKMLSQDPGIYPEQKLTGYYGNLTRQAVFRFQKEHGLPQTGVVDTATKDKLNEVFLSFLCPEQTAIYPELSLKKVTKQFSLPEDYVPPSLENISNKVKTIGLAYLRQDVTPYLIRMFNDAQNDGVYLAVTSGYRKPEIQKYLHDFWLSMGGSSEFDAIAEPGHSEHQLGTTVDLTDSSIEYAGVDDRFAKSDGGRWLAQNAHQYGFTLSYPKGKEKNTGYKYEPWHWRFVGVDIATQLYNQGITFSEAAFDAQEKPYPRSDIKNGLKTSAAAALSVFVGADGTEHILIEKNKETRLPIASITKLMTALVASDIYEADDKVVIDESALQIKGASGNYVAGDALFFRDAMRALLIGSHNEVAAAMAGRIGADVFVRRMNEKAAALGLNNTRYFNAAGVDPDMGSEDINYSSAADTYALLKYIFENRADIFSILQKNKYQLNDVNGIPKANLENTNRFIANQNTALRVLGGKTGGTPKAKLNLAIVSEAPSRGRIISVVIGSNDNFGDMEELLKYVMNSFVW